MTDDLVERLHKRVTMMPGIPTGARLLMEEAADRIAKLEKIYASCCKRAQDHARVRAQQRHRIFELQAMIWQAAWQQMCADCRGTAETTWKDGTPLCYGCAYGRAGWEES